MKLLLPMLLMIPALAFAQKSKEKAPPATIPMKDGEVVYSEVVQVDSVSAQDLFQRAKRFFVDNYKSANDVIQLEDPQTGEITGKGVFKVFFNMGALVGGENTSVRHTISIFVKDGRYKYEIKNLNVNYYSSGTRIGTSYVSGHEVNSSIESYVNSKMKVHQRFVQDIHEEVMATIASIKLAMSKKPEAKNEDW